MIKNMLRSVLLAVAVAIPALANAACEPFPTGLGLYRPSQGDRFDVWSSCILTFMGQVNVGGASTGTVFALAFDVAASTNALSVSTASLRADLNVEISSRIAADNALAASTTTLSVSTASLAATKVNRSGDTMTGALTVTGTSVTASAFFGDGSHLTGISAGESNTFTSSKTFTSIVLVSSDVRVSGYLGVNASTGSRRLDVGGDARASTTLTSGSDTDFIEVNGPSSVIRRVGGTNTLEVRTGGGPGIVIDSSNQVGIATATPSARLHVNGNAFTDGNQTISGDTMMGSGSPTEKLHVKGRILIDTTANGDLLRAFGGSGVQGFKVQSTAGVNAELKVDNSGEFGYVGTQSNFPFKINTNSVERIVVTTTGFVGIGTALPATTLDVLGNAQFGSGVVRSTFSANGEISIGGVASFNAVGGSTFSIVASSRIYAPNASFGTTSTSNNLAVGGAISIFNNAGGAGVLAVGASATATSAPGHTYRRSRGTTAVPTVISQGDTIMAQAAAGYDGTAFGTSGIMRFTASEAFSAGVRGTNFEILVATNGASVAPEIQFFVGSTGRIGLGTAAPLDKVHISSGGSGVNGDSGLFINGSNAHLTVAGPIAAGLASPGHNAIPAMISASSGTGLDFHYYGSSVAVYAVAPGAPGFAGRAMGSGGTRLSPVAVSANTNLAFFTGGGFDGTSWTTGRASMVAVSTEAWTSTAHGTKLTFATTAGGSTSMVTRMTIGNGGNVGVGSTEPAAKLHVSTGGLTLDGTNAQLTVSNAAADAALLDGHVVSTGSAPSISGCGTGASIDGTDTAGTITVGAVPSTDCALTFAVAYASKKPACVVGSSGTAVHPTSLSTAGVTIQGALIAGDVLTYICVGAR